MATEPGILTLSDRARLNNITIRDQALYEILLELAGGTGGGITAEEMFEILNGTSSEGIPQSLFLNGDVAFPFVDLLFSKNNQSVADECADANLLLESIESEVIEISSKINQLPLLQYKNTALLAKTLITAVANVGISCFNVYNPNATGVYVKIYDAASIAAVTVGTTPVDLMIYIPGLSQVVLDGSAWKKVFTNGIVVNVVTGYDDAAAVAPSTGVYITNISVLDAS